MRGMFGKPFSRWFALLAGVGGWCVSHRAQAEDNSPQASLKPRGAHPAEGPKSSRVTHGRSNSGTELATLLTLADANRDGQVTQSEVDELVARRLAERIRLRFQRLDRNRDGRVTHAEVPSMDRERFRRFDFDQDGAFTLAEFSLVLGAQARERCRLLFTRWDQDQNGVLSAADRASPRLASAEKPSTETAR